MKKFPAKAIIFDLDGTLVDTAGDLHAATNHILTSVGRDTVPLHAVKTFVGFGALKLIERGLEHTGGVADHSIENLKNTFLDYYKNNIAEHSALYPGGQYLLDTLKEKNVRIGICTNKPYALAIKLLEELNIIQYFDAITGGDSFPYKKPDPRHLLNTAHQTSKEGPYVMIGDSSPDILAAKSANIPVVAANYGYSDQALEDLNPDATITSLTALQDLLDV